MNSPLELALSHHQKGNLKDAEKYYREAIQSDPNNADANHLFGLLLHQQNRSQEGLNHLNRALQILPGQPHFLYNLGNVLMEVGRVAEAEKSFQKALAANPKYVEAWNNLAGLLLESKRPEEAKAAAERALAIAPDNTLALSNLANALQETGEHKLAQDLYDQLIQKFPENHQWIRNSAENLLKSGAIDKAKERFLSLVEANPNDLNSLLELGIIGAQQSRYEEAASYFQRVLALDPQNCMALNNLGSVYRSLESMETALGYFRKCLDIDPGSEIALSNRNQILSLLIPADRFDEITDTERIQTWEKLFRRCLREDTVLCDLTPNAGLFSLLAARQGAQKILSWESNPHLFRAMQELIQTNHLDGKVELFDSLAQIKKAFFSQPGTKILISQQAQIMEFFHSGYWEIQKFLSEAAEEVQIYPAQLDLKAQLVEMPSLHRVNPIQDISGFDLREFNRFHNPLGKGRIKLYQMDHHKLSSIQHCFTLDIKNLPDCPLGTSRECVTEFSIRRGGTAHAVVFWLDQSLDEELQVDFGPELKHPARCQAIQYLPVQTRLEEGESISMKILWSDHSIFWELKN